MCLVLGGFVQYWVGVFSTSWMCLVLDVFGTGWVCSVLDVFGTGWVCSVLDMFGTGWVCSVLDVFGTGWVCSVLDGCGIVCVFDARHLTCFPLLASWFGGYRWCACTGSTGTPEDDGIYEERTEYQGEAN